MFRDLYSEFGAVLLQPEEITKRGRRSFSSSSFFSRSPLYVAIPSRSLLKTKDLRLGKIFAAIQYMIRYSIFGGSTPESVIKGGSRDPRVI